MRITPDPRFALRHAILACWVLFLVVWILPDFYVGSRFLEQKGRISLEWARYASDTLQAALIGFYSIPIGLVILFIWIHRRAHSWELSPSGMTVHERNRSFHYADLREAEIKETDKGTLCWKSKGDARSHRLYMIPGRMRLVFIREFERLQEEQGKG